MVWFKVLNTLIMKKDSKTECGYVERASKNNIVEKLLLIFDVLRGLVQDEI